MRRAFPTLSDIPDDSIKFEILPGADMAFQLPCITILDDVWESLATGPAKAILVSVRESPDKADLRESNTPISTPRLDYFAIQSP